MLDCAGSLDASQSGIYEVTLGTSAQGGLTGYVRARQLTLMRSPTCDFDLTKVARVRRRRTHAAVQVLHVNPATIEIPRAQKVKIAA